MDVRRGPRKQKFLPIYEYSFQEAVDRGEMEQCRASHEQNTKCATAIEEALGRHYDYNTYCLDTTSAVKEVVDNFDFDRTMYVLANTIRHFDHDGRISRVNKAWAQTIPTYDCKDTGRYFIIRSSPGLVDLFADQVRHDYLLTQPLKAQDVKAEAERILLQLRDLPEPNSPSGEQFIVRISQTFLERAKPKNIDRLMSLLPFSTLKISQIEGRNETYAMIDRGEDRRQKLQMRKPSIKAQLAEKPAPGDKPITKPKDREVR